MNITITENMRVIVINQRLKQHDVEMVSGLIIWINVVI